MHVASPLQKSICCVGFGWSGDAAKDQVFTYREPTLSTVYSVPHGRSN